MTVANATAPVAICQHCGPNDDPLQPAFRDDSLLAGLVPVVERQNERDHEERVVQTHASDAVPDAEGGLADKAWDAVRLHGPEDRSRSLRKNAGRTEELLVAERRHHGVLFPHGRIDRVPMQDISLNDLQLRIVESKLFRVAHEGRHGVAAFEGLRDQLTACSAGGADDQDLRGATGGHLARRART